MIAKYWYVELIFGLVVAVMISLIILLRNRPDLSYKIAYVIASYILIMKITQYASKGIAGDPFPFPLELSSVAYFIFGIFIVFKIRKLDVIGVFFGFTAGFFYLISVFASPSSHVGVLDGLYAENGSITALFRSEDELFAMVNHTLMFFGSSLLLFNVKKYNWKKHWIIIIAFILALAYAWAIHLFSSYGKTASRPLICRICTGEILTTILPNLVVDAKFTTIWLCVTTPVFFIYVTLFYLLNNVCANRREKHGIAGDYFPEKLFPKTKKAN